MVGSCNDHGVLEVPDLRLTWIRRKDSNRFGALGGQFGRRDVPSSR